LVGCVEEESDDDEGGDDDDDNQEGEGGKQRLFNIVTSLGWRGGGS
jgi:hypothetical protein